MELTWDSGYLYAATWGEGILKMPFPPYAVPVPTAVTVQTFPPGLQFTVDGGPAQTAPQTLTLAQGQHTIAVATTQPGGLPGVGWAFTSWSDSGAASHSITVGNASATYTAFFKVQYQLTLGGSPPVGGTVIPTSGTFYDFNTVVPIKATANAGYAFSNWTGNVANPDNSSTTVTMNSPQSITAKFTPTIAPVISGVYNAAGESPVIGGNTWIEIKGTNLAQTKRSWSDQDFVNGQMPVQIDGVSATVNGKPAFVEYVSPSQINVLTPLDAATGAVAVQNRNTTGTSAPVNATMAAYPLGFFVFYAASDKYAAAQHEDYSLLGPTDLYPGYTTPARPNETIILYANGFGQVVPAIVNGSASQEGVLPTPWPAVTIGGLPANVSYAGAISPGLYQFNVIVPAGLPDGDNLLTATYSGSVTQPGVFVAVKN
jgi:uncharacterized protein (TIGR03437 family)